MILDAAVTLGGLIIPPVFDFIKKKFLGPSKDTPEATMSSLATTKPEVLPEYLHAVVEHIKAKVEWFNRDVIGVPSLWVINLRASIRPVTVVLALLSLIFGGANLFGWVVPVPDPGTRVFFEGVVASWFGSRLTKAQ